MTHSSFFPRGEGLTLRQLAEMASADLVHCDDPEHRMFGIASLAEAGPDDVTFFDNPRYTDDLAKSEAGCVVVRSRHLSLVPDRLPALVVRAVTPAFTIVGRELFPQAVAIGGFVGTAGISSQAVVDPTAKLEDGVVIEPFAVVGAGAQIGRDTVIGAHAVIGSGCRVGRGCQIGPSVTLLHSYIGNRVILHAGVRIGQDGFGYVPGPKGLMKAVQIGRVIIQDDVEVGANATIDRGAIRDTVIGEGTKIDNQVQIAHNTVVGRHCAFAAQVGISGSATVGDGVMMGGQAGVNSHSTIGDGAQIAGTASIAGDVPAKGRWGGTPARPIRQWFREITVLADLAKRMPSQGNDDER